MQTSNRCLTWNALADIDIDETSFDAKAGPMHLGRWPAWDIDRGVSEGLRVGPSTHLKIKSAKKYWCGVLIPEHNCVPSIIIRS